MVVIDILHSRARRSAGVGGRQALNPFPTDPPQMASRARRALSIFFEEQADEAHGGRAAAGLHSRHSRENEKARVSGLSLLTPLVEPAKDAA
ncbi:hypothetical protein [Rhizobium sp. CIAT894]|uniref:hypothetical protein n=1 Tax=Rhizobium sp. CIAT894 TaxID=2020312 RepID=UPI000F749369|nr:hypothetical protein [Rhizobium sp. CIAT894]